MKKWVKILSGLVVAGIILTELILRFGVGLGNPPIVERDPEIEYLLVPSKSYHRWGNQISINAHNMRADDFPAKKNTGEKRIMLIGDSVVYGNHRIDQRETIAAVLQSRLRAAYPSCTITVGAIAASSWGPENQRAYIDRFGLFDADAVVMIESSHDIADYPDHRTNLFPYRLNKSYFAIHDAIQGLLEVLDNRKPVDVADVMPYEQRREGSERALDKIFDRAMATGADIIFLFHPTTAELSSPQESADTATSFYEKKAAQYSATYVDGRDAYTKTTKTPMTLYEDSIHPNPTGAAFIAGLVEENLSSTMFDDCNIRG